MINKKYIIILSGIISIIITIILILQNNMYNQELTIKINNNNLTLYKLNLYYEGCYNLTIKNGYFIIYPISSAVNFSMPTYNYLNTTNIIYCNEDISYNITTNFCSPIACPTICTTNGCVKCNYCNNFTYYININYPIIIGENNDYISSSSIGNIVILKYDNNVYSTNNDIIINNIDNNSIYYIISLYINDIKKIIV